MDGITKSDPNNPSAPISLGKYTTALNDTAALVCAGLVAAINALTYIHGYSAAQTGSTAVFVVTSRKGTGIWLNSGTPYTTTITGTLITGVTLTAQGSSSTQAGAYSK